MNHHNTYPLGGIDYPRTLQEFDEWFSTEKACINYLKRLRWPEGFICLTIILMNTPFVSTEGVPRLGVSYFIVSYSKL